MTADNLVVAGVDLSLTATGVARSDGHLQIIGQPGITQMTIHRQMPLFDKTAEEIAWAALWGDDGDRADIVVIETLDMAQSYGGQIERTVLWWKTIEHLVARHTKVLTCISTHLKMYATGKGQADKKAILAAVHRDYPQFEVGRNDNLADAVVLMAMGLTYAGAALTVLPEEHTRAIQTLRGVDDNRPRSIRTPAKKKTQIPRIATTLEVPIVDLDTPGYPTV